MSTILDGKKIAGEIAAEVGNKVREWKTASGKQPGLAVVLVGEDPASKVYVSRKKKACEEAGLYSREVKLAADTTESDLIAEIDRLNADAQIHGILVQLPLPSHIDEQKILERVHPDKDVDGFHPINMGKLLAGADTFLPCTPYGVMELLRRSNIDPLGKRALVVGRSTIVGKPVAQLLMAKHATVTIAHSRTRDLEEEVARAEILVAAVGKAQMIKGSWVQPGAVVIDVGTNMIVDPTHPKGQRLVGDVEYETAATRAAFITPVPGGVGPMTIAMLLVNTLKAFSQQVLHTPFSFEEMSRGS